MLFINLNLYNKFNEYEYNNINIYLLNWLYNKIYIKRKIIKFGGDSFLKKITFIMIIITIALFCGISTFSSPLLANTEINGEENREKYLNIITVNKPQYDMVKSIIKEKHNLQYMIKDEKDINEFKYTNEVIKNVSNMDLFIYTGANFEPWANSFINELQKGNIGIINLSRGIRILNYDYNGINKENPYYFQSIGEYKIALYNIKTAIQDRDPQNRDYYEKNYNEAIEALDKRIEGYKEGISSLKDYTFITLNNNFDYLAKYLNLNIKQLDNRELSEFIKINELDPERVIVIQDGEEKSNIELSQYLTVDLWKYYGDMSFDDLIIYNIEELIKAVDYKNSVLTKKVE